MSPIPNGNSGCQGRTMEGQEERRVRERAEVGAGPHTTQTHTYAHVHRQEDRKCLEWGVGADSVDCARGGFSPTSHTL